MQFYFSIMNKVVVEDISLKKGVFGYFYDIRFWIILFFLIRLVGITNPPLETTHNWRQTTVTMVARNFYEESPKILFPKIDFAGEKSGITGMEFPVFNYLIYLVAKVFGYQDWYGRLINLVFSSFGIYFFFLLVRKYFDKKIAFFASMILLSSVWFIYSRKIMPDTFSMSFMFAGMYFGFKFMDKGIRIRDLFFYVLFCGIGVLSKLPSGFLLILFLPFIINPNISFVKKALFIAFSFIYLIPTGFWYFIWVPYLVHTFGFYHFFMGESLMGGGKEVWLLIGDATEKFYFSALKFSGFLIFLVGIYFMVKEKNKKLITVFLLSFFAFIIIIIKAGHTFALHEYYIIPFAPVMALIAGYAISRFPNKKLGLIILAIIMFEGVINSWSDFFLKKQQWAIVNLEKDLDRFSMRNDKIVINSGMYPTPMYFAHRKGWIASSEELQEDNVLENMHREGAKFVVILKKDFGHEIKIPYPKLLDNEYYTIYKL